MSVEAFIAPLAALAATTVALPLLMSFATRGWLIDRPNARSLHTTPTPRTGGLAMALGVAVGLSLQGLFPAIMVAALCLALLSFLDDWRGLSPAIRLLAHAAAASVFVLSELPDRTLWASAVFAMLIVWMTNLYNFMDGADGLAGGMAVFGFGTYAIASWTAGDPSLAGICAVIAMAALGFVVFNFPPARVFLGDAGSVPLGFLAGGIGLLGWNRQHWPVWFPVAVFAPFVLDATVTLLRRALGRERLWHAHRSHYYQRLVLMGWTHTRLAGVSYSFMGLSAVTALLALRLPPIGAAVLLSCLAFAYAVAGMKVDRRWRQWTSK